MELEFELGLFQLETENVGERVPFASPAGAWSWPVSEGPGVARLESRSWRSLQSISLYAFFSLFFGLFFSLLLTLLALRGDALPFIRAHRHPLPETSCAAPWAS